MTDLQTASNSLVGIVSPILTQLIRLHLFKCDDKMAHWLSLVVAAGCVAAAFVTTHTAFTWTNFGADLGMAFTLGQVIYHNVMHKDDDSQGNN